MKNYPNKFFLCKFFRNFAAIIEKAGLMVDLVDTRDLKSLDHNGRAGSSPARATTCNRKHLIMRCLRFLICKIAPHLHHIFTI